MSEPVWIEEPIVLALHARQLAEHGGEPGIRDRGMLESALARAPQRFAYEAGSDLATLAAAYAFGLSRNHPFIDGNKRIAFVVYRLFLLRNGLEVTAERTERYLTMLAHAAGELSEAEFATWLRKHTAPSPRP